MNWDFDRTASGARYPQFDFRHYNAVVVAPSWTGGDYIDADALGITVRMSFERGVPWVLVTPSSLCLEWLEQISSGPTAYGFLLPAPTKWIEDEFGEQTQ